MRAWQSVGSVLTADLASSASGRAVFRRFVWALIVALVAVAVGPALAHAQTAPENDNYLPPPGYRLSASASSSYRSPEIDTTHATIQTGEITKCGTQDFFFTIWWTFTPGYSGRLQIRTSGYDSVIYAYPGGCVDNVDNNAEAAILTVNAGTTYAIQIGDTLRNSPTRCCITVELFYFADRDLDGFYDDLSPIDRCISKPGTLNGCPDADKDNFSPDLSPQDCDDTVGSVHPGAPEVLNNEFDDDCNGLKGFDRDGDRSPVGDPNQDCDDGNAGIHPGAPEIRGNAVDENCDGHPDPPIDFGRIGQHLAWLKKYSRVRDIRAKDLVPGSRVTLRCKRHRCKLRRRSKKVTRGTSLKLEKFFRSRKVRVGTVIEIAILPPNGEYRGRWRSLKIRSNRAPKETNRCISVGARRPVKCR